jgi:cathepsin L
VAPAAAGPRLDASHFVSPLLASCSYQYEALQDYANAKQKVVRDGLETVIVRVQDDALYEVFPALDRYQCWKDSVGGGSGPTRRLGRRLSAHAAGDDGGRLSLGAAGAAAGAAHAAGDAKPQDLLTFVLPDLSERRWRYSGRRRCGHEGDGEEEAHVWEWDLTGEREQRPCGQGDRGRCPLPLAPFLTGVPTPLSPRCCPAAPPRRAAEGEMAMSYTFCASADGHPRALRMLGVNLLTGGHKDEYVATYYNYTPLDGIADEELQPPAGLHCSEAAPDAVAAAAPASHRPRGLRAGPAAALRRAMPNVHWGDAAYDAFSHRHGRRHGRAGEYAARRDEFRANAQFIADWNAPAPALAAKRHRLGINHLADWSRAEYLALLGRRPRGSAAGALNATSVSPPPPPGPAFLPAVVIWKGTPADSPVKDQAACGSCWAFSAVAPLESALYRTSGRRQLLSEQQLVDCAWGAPASASGCFGGEQPGALEWALARGGLAPAAAYPYRGVNDFCHQDAPKVPLRGRVVAVRGGEAGLQAALLAKGPMAVSMDAEADEFRFYAGGVYSNPSCATAAGDLNHAVVVSGYGAAAAEGGGPAVPYWLVKNMWSTWWGEEGYIRIARKGNDCGVATQPLYVELEPAAELEAK